MRGPFPGMDPYLEHPILWPSVHTRLIVALANQLRPRVRPRYVASVEERVFIEGPDEQRIPDVWIERTHEQEPSSPASTRLETDTALIVEIESLEVRQKRVEILDTHDDMKLVAVIEVVSPNNKRNGQGRTSYLKKQNEKEPWCEKSFNNCYD